jgi:hypothetical protein
LVTTLAAWAFRAFPTVLDPAAGLASASILLSKMEPTEGSLTVSSGLCALSASILLAAVFSVAPSDIGPAILREWVLFFEGQGVPLTHLASFYGLAMVRLVTKRAITTFPD